MLCTSEFSVRFYLKTFPICHRGIILSVHGQLAGGQLAGGQLASGQLASGQLAGDFLEG